MKVARAAVLYAILGSVAPAVATIRIGLYDFGSGSAALDYLIQSRAYDASYTRYDPRAFATVSDFAAADVWLVPSLSRYGDYTLYDGLRANLTVQGGLVFGRVAVTELGDPIVVISVTLAVLLWLLSQRAWRTALYWTGAVALGSLFNTGLKLLLYRPRPVPDLYSGWGTFSFPSGHATVNIVMWGFLAFLATREMKPIGRRIFIALTVGLISLIAISRLYLGAHWFSDVSAGLAFGAAWLTLLGTVYLHHRPERIHSKGLAIAAVAALVCIGTFHIERSHSRDLVLYGVRQTTQTMSIAIWRQGGWNVLPERRVDLKGHYEEPFTVAWVGPPRAIARKLEEAGWREPVKWNLSSLLAWLLPNPGPETLPVLPRLDDGRPPVLIRLLPQPDGSRLVLRLWPTELAIRDEAGRTLPVLVGIVAAQQPRRLLKLITLNRMQGSFDAARDTLAQTLQSGRLVAHDCRLRNEGWHGQMLVLQPPGP